MSKSLRFVYIGKLNDDSVADTPDETRLGDAKYPAEDDLYAALGGASANVSRAVSTLGRLYGTHCSNTILTPMGDPPEQNNYAKFGQFLKAKNAYDNAIAFLNYEGINFVNVSPKGQKTGVASSNVTNFGANITNGSGRAIFKNPTKPVVDPASADLRHIDPKKIGLRAEDVEKLDLSSVDLNSTNLKTLDLEVIRRSFHFFDPETQNNEQVAEENANSLELSDKFMLAAHGLTEHLRAVFEANIHEGDCVFIDTARPLEAFVAAGVCHEKGIPYNIDYGNKSWPKDPDRAAMLSFVLEKAHRIIVPDDAVVDGMEANKRRPTELLGKLIGADVTLDGDGFIEKCEFSEAPRGYSAKTVVMSNGTMPVCFYHDGEVKNIEVEAPAKGAVNTVGVGDTRDGADFYFIARGDDDYMAAQKATAIATIRIQYPDNEWEDHFVQEVHNNACFRKLFEDDLCKLKEMHRIDFEWHDYESEKHAGVVNKGSYLNLNND